MTVAYFECKALFMGRGAKLIVLSNHLCVVAHVYDVWLSAQPHPRAADANDSTTGRYPRYLPTLLPPLCDPRNVRPTPTRGEEHTILMRMVQGTKGPLGLVACPLTAARDPAKQQRTIVTGCAEGRSQPRPNTQRAIPPPGYTRHRSRTIHK